MRKLKGFLPPEIYFGNWKGPIYKMLKANDSIVRNLRLETNVKLKETDALFLVRKNRLYVLLAW